MKRDYKTVHFLCFSFKYQNSTEKCQGAKFSVHLSTFVFWISIGLFRRHTACSCPSHPSSIQVLQHKGRWFKKEKKKGGGREIVLNYEIRSISSVLLIKSYFNIKYSYSILYTSFSPLAEYCYRLVKQETSTTSFFNVLEGQYGFQQLL